MKDFFKKVGLICLVIVSILALSWVIMGNEFFLYKFFTPKTEQVRHDVFKQSQAYNDGMSQDLSDAYKEYMRADKSGKESIRDLLIHQFSSYDADQIKNERLKSFLENLRNLSRSAEEVGTEGAF